ncbi:hypothetical protein [Pseudoroseomonas cervicalis]|uniref:hypothetical protein n=1 Tax=Teichococcus cervicalis TaxID=204525 RepID=UPI0022F1DA55|nr:hypothetical protein [Pseudoroseomonas cervicalis]WBV43796.1 hypothetical protein PFY06_04305 [Pseudoroseomonas cervicalis]
MPEHSPETQDPALPSAPAVPLDEAALDQVVGGTAPGSIAPGGMMTLGPTVFGVTSPTSATFTLTGENGAGATLG